MHREFFDDKLGAEMEVNRILQNVIVVHHIIQVVTAVVGIIICASTMHSFSLVLISLLPILPIFVFVIFWIASKCNYQDLRLILVHFNVVLNILWFITVLPLFYLFLFYVIYGMGSYRDLDSRVNAGPIVMAFLDGIMILSSISIAVWSIWKSARNVVLNARIAKLQHFDCQSRFPFPSDTRNAYEDLNVTEVPRDTYDQPTSTE